MAGRRHHYERAFAAYLHGKDIRFASVQDARKALLPAGTRLACHIEEDESADTQSLKSFDFVLYGPKANLLAEIKGRRVAAGSSSARLECWVTEEDIRSLQIWEQLFGDGFQATLVFVYWCEGLPPTALFEEMTEYDGRWYAIRAISVADYASEMRVRSPRWKTVTLPTEAFSRLSGPLWPLLGDEPKLKPLQGAASVVASGL